MLKKREDGDRRRGRWEDSEKTARRWMSEETEIVPDDSHRPARSKTTNMDASDAVHGENVTAHLKDMNCHEANSVEGGVDVDVDDQLTSLESECRGEGPLSEDCSESRSPKWARKSAPKIGVWISATMKTQRQMRPEPKLSVSERSP